MAPSKKRGSKSSKPPADFGGLDPKLMMSIIKKIPPNPITGRIDLGDIMKHMNQNPSEMDNLTKVMEKAGVDDKMDDDFSGYDFASLAGTIKHESFWVLQLENMGMVDSAGRPVDPQTANSSTGLRPIFMIYCYDDKGSYRLTHECTGLPNSEIILHEADNTTEALSPVVSLVSIRLQPHERSLRPFLDSLPSPFHWRMETREEAEGLADGIDAENQRGIREGFKLAEKLKSSGNAAFAKKDRATAIKAYTDASEHLIDVLSQKPIPDDEKLAKRQLSICYSNRAATLLIPGDGMDASKALYDSILAEKADPSYNKSYIRQAAAHQALGDLNKAQESIARALRRTDLQTDTGLADRLLQLQTAEKGLSNDRTTFKA